MDRWKSRGGRSQRTESKKKEDQRRQRQKKEDQDQGAVEKVFFHCGGSQSRLAKAVGAETCGGMSDEHLHAVVTRAKPFWEFLGALLEVEMWKMCTPFGTTQISKSPFWGTPILGNHHVVVDRV